MTNLKLFHWILLAVLIVPQQPESNLQQPPLASKWRPTKIVGMDYPALARTARIMGRVKIKCILGKDGAVLSAELASSSNSSAEVNLLGKFAQANAREWKFEPTDENDQRDYFAILEYSFDIQFKAAAPFGSRFVFESPNSVRVTAEISDAIIVD